MLEDFQYFKNPNFSNRYISPEKLFFYLQENFRDYISPLGKSTLGLPIYKFSYGSGNVKVLAWSQMHGNESNSTHAMLDVLYSLEKQQKLQDFLWKSISLDFIFMLNPDGSKIWTRRNALDVDINRDFIKESSVEMKAFKKFALSGSYDYGLNLHEQRTIFTTDHKNPATLSFLAPSENFEREITENRKKSMAVIASIYEVLKTKIPHQIGRYSDEFYPTSVGDNLMKAGVPVILFEGGHFPEDYVRTHTRKFYSIALFEAFRAMIQLNGKTQDFEKYFEIPENKTSHYDIIYRNVKLNTDFECILDIAIQFQETLRAGEQEIQFVPYVAEIGDLGKKIGWKEIDCTEKTYLSKSEKKFPKIDAIQDFDIV